MVDVLSDLPGWGIFLAGAIIGITIMWLVAKLIPKKITDEQQNRAAAVSNIFANIQPDAEVPFAIADKDGTLSFATNSFKKLFPLRSGNEKINLLRCFHSDDRRWWREHVAIGHVKFSSKHFSLPESLKHIYLNILKDERTPQIFLLAMDLTSLYRANQHLENSTRHDSILSSFAPFGLLVDEDGIVRQVNTAFCNMFGLSADVLYANFWLKQLQPDTANKIITASESFTATDYSNKIVEIELKDSNGRNFWCQFALHQEFNNGSTVSYWYFIDANKQKALAQELKQSSVVFEASSEAIMVVDANKQVKMVNPAFTEMTGFAPKDIKGRNPQILGSERKDIKQLESIWHEAERNGSWQGEVWKRRKSGERYPEWLSITAVKNKDNKILEYVAISSDMTTRKQAENRIRYQANYDPLTDLPNRNLFMDRLKQGISRARREGTMLSLLFIDLDRFKYINDSYGHNIGDQLLIKVANLLKDCVRSSDSIARFGGDEFAIILSPIYGSKNASRVASLVLERLSKPIDLDGYEVVSGGSIGISLYPNDGDSEEQLVKNADIAMYRAKEKGRNNYQFFTEQMQQSAQERMSLERDLRSAFTNNKLSMAFQPQMDCKTGKVGGLEVLMRWQNADKGAVSPAVFIALAEDTGLIVPMGNWIMKTACEKYVYWKKLGVAPEYLAVNVSTRQFRAKNFIGTVKDVLNTTGMSPKNLELELTESMLMEDQQFAIKMLQDLRDLGLKISIDDFGTGYSSLSYLKKFPLNNLKVDQSFVKDIMDNEDDASIVKAIIDLGHTLNMQVIAEGVETKEQQDLLKQYGVDFIQGYYFSKPMNSDLCEKFLFEKKNLPEVTPLKRTS
ncbi:MAG TPA: EAL domain-containing protein [Aeromonadales bacterium]|nr:EAL domain-containing protein [Aeromonadales bacterium]